MVEYQGYDTPERFAIRGDLDAERAIKRLRQIASEKQKLINFHQAKIDEITDDCNYESEFLTRQLREYFSTLKSRETKTQFSYELPSGKLVLKKAKTDFKITDEDKFAAAVAERLPEMMKIKTVSKPDWAEIKKRLVNNGAAVYVTDDGEIIRLDGVELIETPERFEVK